jgi:alpha-amylase
MSNVTLLLAFHNHQPDGNFDHVFAQSYDDCYRPLLDALAEFPTVKASLHHTGPLLEWLERHRPGYLTDLRRLVERGQVEILGGGFYEPMLAVLPDEDAHGQLRLMQDFCAERLGQRPRGMWLAERVWEPALAQTIARAGLEYTLIDDTHFRYAGIAGPLFGHYVTEKSGTPLAIFPIEKEMRYAIPFKSVDETMAELGKLGESARRAHLPAVVTYGDDGEKFGVWPGTKDWVWGKGWLKRFFARLAEADSPVETATLSTALDRFAPSGRVYLPTASYHEMGEWTLPAEQQNAFHDGGEALKRIDPHLAETLAPFLRGGIWQGFMARYPEANFMHKKMVWVSRKLSEAEKRAPSPALQEARKEVWRGQCNCAYWHGLFGGLYLNYLRHAVYSHLIGAEAAADAAIGKLGNLVTVEIADFDADLRKEVMLANRHLWVGLKPDAGGAFFELDARAQRFNLANVLGRHPEGYHVKLKRALEDKRRGHGGHGGEQPKSIHDQVVVKDDHLDELLHYDRHPRLGFIDHFLAEGTTLSQFARSTHEEKSDFPGAAYELIAATGGEAGIVELHRDGWIDGQRVGVDKTISLRGSKLSCRWKIRLGEDQREVRVLFAPELSLTLLAGNDPGRRYSAPGRTVEPNHLASAGVLEHCPRLELSDEWSKLRIALEASGEPTFWRFPLETASQSESGFERTYQGSVLAPVWPLRLIPGKTFETSLTVDVGTLES